MSSRKLRWRVKLFSVRLLFDAFHAEAAFIQSALVGGVEVITFDRSLVGVEAACPTGHLVLALEL